MPSYQRYLREKKILQEEKKIEETFTGSVETDAALGAAALAGAGALAKKGYSAYKARKAGAPAPTDPTATPPTPETPKPSLGDRMKDLGSRVANRKMSIKFLSPEYLASAGEIKIDDLDGLTIGTNTGDFQVGDKTKAGTAGMIAKIGIDNSDPKNKKYVIIKTGSVNIYKGTTQITREELLKNDVITLGDGTSPGDQIQFQAISTTAAGRLARGIRNLGKKKVEDVTDTTASAAAAASSDGFDEAARKLGINDPSQIKSLISGIVNPFGVQI